MEKIIDDIVRWLKEQVKDAGLKGLIVGLSGGLDSAVVAYLIQRAFPNNSLAVKMPLYSNPIDMKHADLVIQGCQIDSMTIDLTETHQMLLTQINNELSSRKEKYETAEQLADANLRARLRMSTLYTLATYYQYLVVGTDNASEWYTGYFTKYGDGGVDLLPIVSLTKDEVKQIARKLNVPSEVIEKAPSADLWEGQTDEEEMGVTYDAIDAYLRGEPIPTSDRERIEKMHHRSEHKRQIPKQFLIHRENKAGKS